jgi:hypothetical protein
MENERIGDMTLEELKALIESTVDQRIRKIRKPQSSRSIDEINASIREHRWTPPPGSPSVLELLREDRDR